MSHPPHFHDRDRLQTDAPADADDGGTDVQADSALAPDAPLESDGAGADVDATSPPEDTPSDAAEATSSDIDAERAWWKEAVVYQVYPWSFNDTNEDGVGDIQGIVERLDYLDALGIDVVWLNPVYESPQVDNGYDISDYHSIHEQFGTMAELDQLLEGLHERGMRLVMDLAVNHTSDEHAWFVRSRQSPEGEFGDYYIWAEGDGDEPPNNWESFFGGSAWKYDERRGEYYLHLFHERQPDLNWSNPQVREEVYELMEWWLRRGVDGFRMDVINLVSKPQELPPGDASDNWVGSEHFVNGPDVLDHLGELRERVLDEHDAMTVGEMPEVSVDQAREYTGTDGPLDMVFNFDHMRLDFGERGRWDVGDWSLCDLKEILSEWQTGLVDDGWTSLFFENHDQPRVVSRFGDDEQFRYESATVVATLLLTLRGTPFIYQGQEIGMTNAQWASLEAVRDVDTVQHVRRLMDEHGIEDYDEVRELVEHRTRDNARTPMQWDDSEHAGFTDGEPWIAVNSNYEEINVAAERAAEESVFTFYQDLIALRHERDVLVYGEYELLLPDHEQVFAYTRTLETDAGVERVLVVLNFDADWVEVDLPFADCELLVSNYEVPDPTLGRTELRPYEARVYAY